MGKLLETAKECYEIVLNNFSEIEVLNKNWDNEDLKSILQYDVLRMVSILYLFSNEEKRNEIVKSTEEIFEYAATEECICAIIDGTNSNTIISELYRRSPYISSFAYAIDCKLTEKKLTSLLQSTLLAIIFGIYAPEGTASGDFPMLLTLAYVECCNNRMKKAEVQESSIINLGILPSFESWMVDFNFEEENYIETEHLDSKKCKKIYQTIKRFVENGGLTELVEKSKDKTIDDLVSVKKYEKIIEEIKNLDYQMSIRKFILDNIKITVTTGTENDEDDDTDIDEIIAKFRKKQEKLDRIFGDTCSIVKSDDNDGSELYVGSLWDCIDFVWNHKDAIEDDDWWIISWENKKEYFYSFSSFIERIEKTEKNTPEIFDSKILPAIYAHADMIFVNEQNFDDLWEQLQKIEDKYRSGINYENRYYITEWESELCYEQGKYLEFIEWSGEKIENIPDTEIPYITYSKMNKEQLKYYLYWRSCFRKENFIFTGMRSFYYLCAYELLADFGGRTAEATLEQLELLYAYYKPEGLTNAGWINEYAKVHHLTIDNENTKKLTSWYAQNDDYYNNIHEIGNGNFDNAFEVMNKKSNWKLAKSSFVNKSGCLEHIKMAVTELLPRVEDLFACHGLAMTDWLVGVIREVSKEKWPYSGSVWNHSVVKRIVKEPFREKVLEYAYPDGAIYITDEMGNIKRKTSTCMNYCDPYLSEYILKYSEMLFREYFEYQYLTWPSELKGALRMKFANGSDYVLSVDKNEQMKQKLYCGLYSELTSVIKDGIHNYIEKHLSEMEVLKEKFKAQEVKRESNLPISKKSPAVEELANYIDVASSETTIQDLLQFYDSMTLTTKKTKAKIITNWIWDYWILDGCRVSYENLKERVVGNHWNICGQKAITERKYDDALPYFFSFYDIRCGVLKQKVKAELIEDAVIITFATIDKLLQYNGVDSVNIFLGRWHKRTWDVFAGEEKININKSGRVVQNIDDVEIYEYDSNGNQATVSQYSRDESSMQFVNYVLKAIDNNFRVICGYKGLLKNDIAIETLYDDINYKLCCNKIQKVIDIVVNKVAELNISKGNNNITAKIVINNNDQRQYDFDVNNSINYFVEVEEIVEEVVRSYYELETDIVVEQKPLYDMLEIEIDNFTIASFYGKYGEHEHTVHQKQIDLNLTRFYNIYDELQERVLDIASNRVMFNPNFNFSLSKVMQQVSGITGKDLAVMSSLVEDGNDFAQWIEWIKNGKLVFPKNQPYIQVLFHLAINGYVLKDTPEICLIIMCEIINYYFDTVEKYDQSAHLLLEWTKQYWMLYCSDISYGDFKRLFRFNIVFEGECASRLAKDYFLVNMEYLQRSELVSFYNQNCDYKIIHGGLVKAGKRGLLEKSLKQVHIALEDLWNQYDKDLYKDFQKEDVEIVTINRPIFYRSILTVETVKYLRELQGQKFSFGQEEYAMNFDYNRMLPILSAEIKEVRHMSSKVLLDYIIKQTEKVLREWLGMGSNFKLSEKRLQELFEDELYKENTESHIIARTIEDAVVFACEMDDSQTVVMY